MAEEGKSRLGRGLGALIGDLDTAAAAPARGGAPREVGIDRLSANPFQPRKTFREDDLEDLANSIREKGVIQPIVVRKAQGETDRYQIVAGERRWRAAQRAGLHLVPIVVKDFSDAEALEVAIIENVQRADLNAVEEAEGYKSLMDSFGYTQEKLSTLIGKSRSHIANTVRLLGLPDPVRTMIVKGELTAGHARALLGVTDPEAAARDIVKGGMTVRQAEHKARAKKPAAARAPKAKDADTRALEQNVSNALGLQVEISFAGDSRGGEVRIRYCSLEQLDDVCRRLIAPGIGAQM